MKSSRVGASLDVLSSSCVPPGPSGVNIGKTNDSVARNVFTPKRLPNGRFMSKSQVEAFERGVPIEEIVRMAEIAAKEKQDEETANGDSNSPKKKKHSKKKPNSRPSGSDTSVLPESSGLVSSVENAATSGVRLNQPQPGHANFHSSIKVINGQPVIQARLERVQTPDGNFMTVAVLPADVNILSAGGMVVPQPSLERQSSPSNSPGFVVRLVTPAPSAQKLLTRKFLLSDQPVLNFPSTMRHQPLSTPAPGPTQDECGRKQQTIALPASLPSERFTFKLSAEDERTVAELSCKIARYQATSNRTPLDHQMLATMEEKRRSILHAAASTQLRMMSVVTSNVNLGMVSSCPQSMQVVNGQPNALHLENSGNSSHLAGDVASVNVIPGQGLMADQSVHTVPTFVTKESPTEKRCRRVKELIAYDETSVNQPDCTTPFADQHDVLKRLLPYRLYDEPDIDQRLLQSVDHDFQRYIGCCRRQSRVLYRRYFEAIEKFSSWTSSLNGMISSAIMLDDEKRALDQERADAARSPERYVEEITGSSSKWKESGEIGVGVEQNQPQSAQDDWMALDRPDRLTGHATLDSPSAPQIDQASSMEGDECGRVDAMSSEDTCADERIEARIAVKVVLRKRRMACPASSASSESTDVSADGVTDGGKGDVTTSINADAGEDGELRVPPLKIRLQCKDTAGPSDMGHWFDLESVERGQARPAGSAQSEDEDEANSATTTSPGDSGLDDASDLDHHQPNHTQAIPPLKLFRTGPGPVPDAGWVSVGGPRDNEMSDDDNDHTGSF